ncbi:MAG TPA: serine/threonine-protein kinase, partial [Anaeromyxobacteraceae bacterium]|nr:serine/threonine-protein kinase [Anaeromyxobacteraceae bacterium]
MPLCAKCQREGPEGALFCPFCSAPILAPQGRAEAADPLIGQTIKGTYLVQQRIGSGGMGQVYKAVQINLDRPVALKLLRPSFLSDQTIVQRFHREARAASRLHHPNVISVTDFGQTEDGTLFMAMEYLPGRNLLKLMAEEFPLGERRVVQLAGQILSALAEAHGAGIVHRDLKPENVMVESRRDEPDFVKVLDFGIAKIQEPDDRGGRLTQTGLIFGTPDYMSPEQATLVPLDARSDLYSVGVMLYEMLAGRHPFQAATPPAMAQAHAVQPPPPMSERCPPGHRVSPALEALVMRALAKNPEDRFETAEQMRRELLDCPLDPGLDVVPAGTTAIPPPRTPLPAPALPSGAAPGTLPGRRPVPL